MATGRQRYLSAEDLEAILGVTSRLAAPFDLATMLAEVVNAAKQVLKADRGSVWLYDAPRDELVLEVATGLAAVRIQFMGLTMPKIEKFTVEKIMVMADVKLDMHKRLDYYLIRQ